MKNRSDKPAAPSPSLELLSARGRVFVSRRCGHPVPRTERLQTAHVPSLRTLEALRQVRVSGGPLSLREPGRRARLSRWLRRRWSPAGRDSGGQIPSGSRTRCSPRPCVCPRACPHEHAVCVSRALLTRTPVLLGLGSPSPRVTSPSLTLETSAQSPFPDPVPFAGPHIQPTRNRKGQEQAETL